MRALDERDRVRNGTGGSDNCHVCGDDAQVAVGTHVHCGAEYEDMGPCPFCERGWRLEYGEAGAKRWRDGFWQGRDLPSSLIERFVDRPAAAHLPQHQQLANIRWLADSVGFSGMDEGGFRPVAE